MDQQRHISPQTTCRSCYSTRLDDILSLGDQYLSDFIAEDKKLEKYPLDLMLCKECFLLQLKHTAPQSSLYTERYGYKSGMNQTMREELKSIVEKGMRKARRQTQITVVDIGANDGTLLSHYPRSTFRIGIEPILKFADECGKHANIVIADFFNYVSYKEKMKGKKADIITAISCFYDIEQPNKFLDDIVKILHKKGIFIIQQNYLCSMLKQNAFDNIVHEHLEYYSLLSLEHLLKRHGLEVFDVELSGVNGGSFRTYVSFVGERRIKKTVVRLRGREKRADLTNSKIYQTFALRVKKNREKLLKLLHRIVGQGKTVYVYGASTRGNTLLQYYTIDRTLIKAAVERNPEKWGKKIASVGIPIISEEQARKDKPDYMLVLPWFFKNEFLRREKLYLAAGGHFIFPLPKLSVV